jgi:hypothetical protein
MPRLVTIADAKKRDAQIELASPSKRDDARWVRATDGAPLRLERLIKTIEKTTDEALSAQHGDALAKAIVEGDPEIELEQVGRRLGYATRVWVKPGGQVLYAARVLSVVTTPDGTEKSRQDFIDVEANVGEELPPIPWTGRLMARADVVRRFALVRKLQLRHVNGLTFDFLYEMAKALSDEGKMLLVGAGPKGAAPLVFQTNGSPFRGFLEGRVDGESYLLVLHLSNLELKKVALPTDAGTKTDTKESAS